MKPLAVLASIAISLTARLAIADPTAAPTKPAALEHLKLGNRLVDLEKFDDAIVEYEQGALIEAAPVFWFDIGLAHRRAHRYREAIRAYQTFLYKITDDKDASADEARAMVERLVDDMEHSLTAPPTHPAPIGTSPASPTSSSTPLRDNGTSEPRWYHDRVGWLLAGGGAIALGAGAGLLVSASSLDDQAAHTANFDERNRLADRASLRRSAGTITTVVGGAIVVVAIIKLATPPSRAAKTAGRSQHLAPGPGTFGLALLFGF